MASTLHPTLYTLDSKGKVRTWAMERDGNRYRTISGLEDGAKTPSGWTTTSPKNTGRANETTPERQAELEVQAEYRKKLDRKYHEDRATVGGAKFFAPMLAETFKGWGKLADTAGVSSQPKLDGIRCIATREGLFTRQGKRIVSCPHIEEALHGLFAATPHVVLDGELYNHALREDFNTIASLVRQTKPTAEDLTKSAAMVQYHVYDMPVTDSIRAVRFDDRFNRLCVCLPHPQPCVVLVFPVPATQSFLDADLAAFLAAGYEGQMVRLNAPYEAGKRSKSLLKRKEFQDAEFPVVRLEEGNGNWAGYAKRAVLRLPDGREFGAGIKGSQEFTKGLLAKPSPKTATIRYFALTPDGIPRFPVAVAFFEGERDI